MRRALHPTLFAKQLQEHVGVCAGKHDVAAMNVGVGRAGEGMRSREIACCTVDCCVCFVLAVCRGAATGAGDKSG